MLDKLSHRSEALKDLGSNYYSNFDVLLPTRVDGGAEDYGVFNNLIGSTTPGFIPAYNKDDSVKAKAGMGFDSMKGQSSGLISPFENLTAENILPGFGGTFDEEKNNPHAQDFSHIPWE